MGSAVRVAFAHGPNLEARNSFAIRKHSQRADVEGATGTDCAGSAAINRGRRCPGSAERSWRCLVLGEIDLMSGEYASRSSLKLSNGQEELLEAVSATGKPVVLVLVNGRPLDISWASEHVPAILEAWYPGSQGGNGIADVLFGDANPSGHLPVSWPRSTGQLPLYYNHNLTQNPETAPDFKSRYWDIPSTPLYPFGYGLSYTTFSFDNLKVTPTARTGKTVEVSADVTNTWQPRRRCRSSALHPPARRKRVPPRTAVEGIRACRIRTGRETHRAFHAGERRIAILEPRLKRSGSSSQSSSTYG